MKIKELKTLSKQERAEKLEQLQNELLKLRGQVAVGSAPKSPGQITKVKRSIARLMFLKAQEVEDTKKE